MDNNNGSKKFYARSVPAALREIRRAFGPDAIILGTEYLPVELRGAQLSSKVSRVVIQAAPADAVDSFKRSRVDRVLETPTMVSPHSLTKLERPSPQQVYRDRLDVARKNRLSSPDVSRNEIMPLTMGNPIVRGHNVTKKTMKTSSKSSGNGRAVSSVKQKPVRKKAVNGTKATTLQARKKKAGDSKVKLHQVLRELHSLSEDLQKKNGVSEGVQDQVDTHMQETEVKQTKQMGENVIGKESDISKPQEESELSFVDWKVPAKARRNPYLESNIKEPKARVAPVSVKPSEKSNVAISESNLNATGASGLISATRLQELLRAQYVDEAVIQRLIQRVHPLEGHQNPIQDTCSELADALSDYLYDPQPDPDSERQRIIALTGPTGVGKTTTLAKIASFHALKRGQKVGLITLDTYRVAATEQLKTYARLLGVELVIVHDPARLTRAIEGFSHMDLVLVDTPGYSPNDSKALHRLAQGLRSVPSMETHLVVPATMRGDEMQRVITRFKPLGYNRLIFSKLDEACTCGDILNTWITNEFTVSYFTTGQRVPEDFEKATPQALCRRLVQPQESLQIQCR